MSGARLVGLTGGIGSGKSTVSRMLARLGAEVIDADVLARDVVEPGQPALAKIVERFGSEIVDAVGRLDRKKLAEVVFKDDRAREDLNRIVHPAVAQRAQEEIASRAARGAPLIVYDVPLLYETGLDAAFPEIIVVFASDEARRARLQARDGFSNAEIDARIRAQMPLDEKVKRAAHVIQNGGALDETERQIRDLYRRLTEDEPHPG